ncbi:cupin-like domain-containing protein [Caulobacter segnis]
MFGPEPPMAGIWIGNRTGRRRWDIIQQYRRLRRGPAAHFPPDQVSRRPGAREPTPGERVVSTWSFENRTSTPTPAPRGAGERSRWPRWSPGDVLVYPALWWHQVEALEQAHSACW